jgi:ubiquinol-cytochrome c reductase cytochrome b subunit/menaquinol-cytochrome c reductase cytochrome b/c subunit
MILLFLLPFYDRRPERRPERRPIATLAGIAVIVAMAYLTVRGDNAGTPFALEVATPAAVVHNGQPAVARWNEGRLVIAQSGCEACHTIGNNGNGGPGPDLTHVGSRLAQLEIARTLVNPTAPMPSFKNLPPKKFQAVVTFLEDLK